MAAIAAAVLIATGTVVAPQRAAAQGAVPCTAIENDTERLACYDRALRPAPASAPAARTRSAPATTEVAPREERRVRESTARVAPAAPVAGRTVDAEIVPIVVVGVRALPGRETTFTAEDGTRWVQTDSAQIVGLPEPPFEAELKPGAMGSRFLQPKDHPRAIRVRPADR